MMLSQSTPVSARLILIGFSIGEIILIFSLIIASTATIVVIVTIHEHRALPNRVIESFLKKQKENCPSHGSNSQCGCDYCKAISGSQKCLLLTVTGLLYEEKLEHEKRARQNFNYEYKAELAEAEIQARQLINRPVFVSRLRVRARLSIQPYNRNS